MVFAPYSLSLRIALIVRIQDATVCGMTFARASLSTNSLLGLHKNKEVKHGKKKRLRIYGA